MADEQTTTGYRPPSPAGYRPPSPAGPDRVRAAPTDDPPTDPADTGRTLVKVTVNLTPRAVDALDLACGRTRDSKTDTINRALVVYNLVLELMERGGGQLVFQNRDGDTERIHLL